MRQYTSAERCMLLLFAQLGEEYPLRPAVYRGMNQMLNTLGPSGADPDSEVNQEELIRLGLDPETAQALLSRLDRLEALDLHLAWLNRHSIRVVTRISPEYPMGLRRRLGDRAPMILYCGGNLSLFQSECMSLVGSRQLRTPGQLFADTFGEATAEQGITYVSGGAEGADTVGFEAAMRGRGEAILFLPDSLTDRMDEYRELLFSDRLLLVSEGGFDLPFSIPRAYERNRLIHTMGESVFVAQSDYETGGTWQGTMENLKHGWSPVYVCCGERSDPGTQGLIRQGCTPVTVEDLRDLRSLEPSQTTLF